MAVIIHGGAFVFGIPETKKPILGIPAGVNCRVVYSHNDWVRVILRWPDKFVTRHVVKSVGDDFILSYCTYRPTKSQKRHENK